MPVRARQSGRAPKPSWARQACRTLIGFGSTEWVLPLVANSYRGGRAGFSAVLELDTSNFSRALSQFAH